MHRSLVLAVVLTAAGPVVHAMPARAAEPLRAPQSTCAQKVAAATDGTAYGAGDCAVGQASKGVRYSVRRPGGAWRDLGLAWPDKRVEAVAADDTATFVVMSCTSDQTGCATADPLGKDFFVGKVPHGGRPSALTPLGSTELGNDTATVAARGGRWWAAYTHTVRDRDDPGSGSQAVFYRKTVGGPGAGQVPAPSDPAGRTFSYAPSIALTASGAVLAFLSQPDDPEDRAQLQLATALSDGRFRTQPYAPAADAPAAEPDIAVSGGRTYVAWNRARRPALGLERDGVLRRVDLPARGLVGAVSVAASGGHVVVSSDESFPYQGQRTTRVYVRTLDSTGTVRSSTEVTAAAGRRDPHLDAGLDDSTAARGAATIAFSVGSRNTLARFTSSQQ